MPQRAEIVAYSLAFGITHVANTLLAARSPLRADLALKQIKDASTCDAAEFAEYGELPPSVLGLLAASVPRARVRNGPGGLNRARMVGAGGRLGSADRWVVHRGRRRGWRRRQLATPSLGF